MPFDENWFRCKRKMLFYLIENFKFLDWLNTNNQTFILKRKSSKLFYFKLVFVFILIGRNATGI